ncbi:MAG: molybdopterin molybdotransferase MoeA, partial [Thermotaleaceae bacterium]
MITIEEALKIILEETKMLGLESKDILSSLNYVIGEDIYSKDMLPFFDKSAMDGYAIRSEDSENYTTLKVKGIIKAGDYCSEELKAGEALKIMTGAALPPGADAVIEIEKVKIDGDNIVLADFPSKWSNVIRKGEEISIGDLAIETGKVIRAPEIGFLASLGYNNVQVYRKPTIAILITGDELVDICEKFTAGKIRNSNEYSLNALIQNIGAKPLSLGIVPDDKSIIKEKMIYAFENADIVISSGGASVGDYDFIEAALSGIGADIKFTEISIKPGKPVTFATYNNKLF